MICVVINAAIRQNFVLGLVSRSYVACCRA